MPVFLLARVAITAALGVSGTFISLASLTATPKPGSLPMELCKACLLLQHEMSETHPSSSLKFDKRAVRRMCGKTIGVVEYYGCTVCKTKWLRELPTSGNPIKWARHIRTKLYLNEDDIDVLAKQGISLADTETRILIRTLRTATARAGIA